MKKRTVAAIRVSIVSGAVSVFVCGFVGIVGLMYLGDRFGNPAIRTIHNPVESAPVPVD